MGSYYQFSTFKHFSGAKIVNDIWYTLTTKMYPDNTDPVMHSHGSSPRHFFTCLVAVLTFSIDQLTKLTASSLLMTGQSVPPQGFFRITLTHNTGGAFGMFPDQTTLLIVASILGIGVLSLLYIKQYFTGPLFNLSLGLQIGGAIGNLVNRIFQGKVVDFIDIGIWPVFNIADSAMVVGITILMFLVFRKQDSNVINDKGTAPSNSNEFHDDRML